VQARPSGTRRPEARSTSTQLESHTAEALLAGLRGSGLVAHLHCAAGTPGSPTAAQRAGVCVCCAPCVQLAARAECYSGRRPLLLPFTQVFEFVGSSMPDLEYEFMVEDMRVAAGAGGRRGVCVPGRAYTRPALCSAVAHAGRSTIRAALVAWRGRGCAGLARAARLTLCVRAAR
jgi:hypothetical protein